MYDLMEGVHVLQAIGGTGAVSWLHLTALLLLAIAIAALISTVRDEDGSVIALFLAIITVILLVISINNIHKVRYIVTMDDIANINEVSSQYDIKTNYDGTYTLTEKDNPNEKE